MNEDGYTYTYRTLERLRQQNPDTDYYFIIGADSLYDFATWKEPARICQACTIVVAARNHVPTPSLDQEMTYLSHQYGGCFIRLDTLNIDISSQLIRQWIQEGKSLRYYVPDRWFPISGNIIFILRQKENLNTMAEYDFIKIQKKLQNIWMRTDFIIPLALCIPVQLWQWLHDCP